MVQVAVMPMAALDEGEMLVVKAQGLDILISLVYGQYYAVEAYCSHARQALATGRLQGYEVSCPLHGAKFDVRNGACTKRPAEVGLRSFPVTLEAGKVWVEV